MTDFEPLDDRVAKQITDMLNTITVHRYPMMDKHYHTTDTQAFWEVFYLYNQIVKGMNK